jgi:hypothetical protein
VEEGWDLDDVPRVIALDAAAATAGLVYEFPGDSLFAIRSLAFKLTTAAGGGARQVIAELEDAFGAPVFAVAAPGTQAGGLTVEYSFAPLVPAFGSAALGAMGGPFAGSLLPQNMQVAITVAAAAAGDLIFDGRLLVHRLERP